MIIQLTDADRKGRKVLLSTAQGFLMNGVNALDPSDSYTVVRMGETSCMTVRETPEQIAALFAAAEREARIRENAARLLAAFIVSGSELESTILHGVSGQHALSLERRLDEFFAAERAAKKTGEE